MIPAKEFEGELWIKAADFHRQKKEWQGLTDEECDEIWEECLGVFDCLKMTQAKLKEKNG